MLITLTLLELYCYPEFPIKLHSLNCLFPCFKFICEAKNYREEQKVILFLLKSLLLFQTCHWCFANSPILSISQSGTMLPIQTSCSHCKRDFTWTSQPLVLGKFHAENLFLSFISNWYSRQFRVTQRDGSSSLFLLWGSSMSSSVLSSPSTFNFNLTLSSFWTISTSAFTPTTLNSNTISYIFASASTSTATTSKK